MYEYILSKKWKKDGKNEEKIKVIRRLFYFGFINFSFIFYGVLCRKSLLYKRLENEFRFTSGNACGYS